MDKRRLRECDIQSEAFQYACELIDKHIYQVLEQVYDGTWEFELEETLCYLMDVVQGGYFAMEQIKLIEEDSHE